jgi:hypothetical protein
MSGQPTKKPSDVQAFRNAYLETIGLQANLNAENLEANKVYKATGSLPAKSTITDTRTTSEILADIEGLKISLITTLKPLFEPFTASQVLQRIERSPLNKDGSLFTFFSQRADEFVANLQRMYKYGIKGDENDIEQFVAFIEKAFSSTKTMASTVRGYFDSAKSAQSSMSLGEIDKYNAELNIFNLNFISKMYSMSKPNVTSFQSQSLINDIRTFISAHIRLVTSQSYNLFIYTVSEIMNLKGGVNEISRSEVAMVYEQFQDYMKLLPSINNINTLLLQLEKSLSNKQPQLTDDIVLELYQMFPPINMLEGLSVRIDKINSDNAFLRQAVDRKSQPYSSSQPQQPVLTIGSQPQQPDPSLNLPLPPTVANRQNPKALPAPPPAQLTDVEIGELGNKTTERLGMIINSEINLTQDEQDILEDILDESFEVFTTSMQKGATEAEAKQYATEYTNDRLEYFFNLRLPDDVIGSGLRKRRGRPKGRGIKKTFDEYIDPDAGVKSKTPFISFGKHFINNNKLQDGVISLRHKSGAGLPNFPSRKVSPNLSSIIKTIVGGGMPSYNDVDKLSDEEKNYLHQISKKSDLTQMLAIPAPSKDKMEKDFNQFEIMKGEIMAGNDSKDLIKKFKVLLLRLVNTGQLPKAQVQEIMTELLEMGY